MKNTAGFTLLELAFVLVIIGLLLAGGLPAASLLVQHNKVIADRALLAQARQALIGYALAHGNFPTPDNNGTLPHGLLGIAAKDSHGGQLRYTANPALRRGDDTGGVASFCAGVRALIPQGKGVPRICAGVDGRCDASTMVAFVLIAVGQNHRADGVNAVDDGVFENPSRRWNRGYDDIVVSYGLPQVMADCYGIAR